MAMLLFRNDLASLMERSPTNPFVLASLLLNEF